MQKVPGLHFSVLSRSEILIVAAAATESLKVEHLCDSSFSWKLFFTALCGRLLRQMDTTVSETTTFRLPALTDHSGKNKFLEVTTHFVLLDYN